jgi:uncharacterized membrane protein
MNRFLKAVGISLAIALVFTGCEEVLTQLKDELKPGQQTKQEELDFSLVLENTEPEARYSAVIYGTDGAPVAGAEGTPLADDSVVFAFLVLPGEYDLKITEKAGSVKTTKTDSVVFVDGLPKVIIGWDGLLEADAAEEPVSDEDEAVEDTEDEAVTEEPEAVEETDTEEEAVAEEPEAVEETDTEEETVTEEPKEEPRDEPKADEPKEEPRDEPKADEPKADEPKEEPRDEPEEVTAEPEPIYNIHVFRSSEGFPGVEVGYGPQEPITYTVENNGNQPTGDISIILNDGSGAFVLSTDSIPSLPAGDTATFTITPANGLAEGFYTDAVVIKTSQPEYINQRVVGHGLSFHVKASQPEEAVAPVYGITLSENGTYSFPSASFGYGAQTAKSVTITNTGNQPTGALTLAQSNSMVFSLSATSVNSIAAGGAATFTVTPKTGIAAASYNSIVTVTGDNGISASFRVSFTVTATYGIITLSQTETYTFPEVIFSYGAQTAKQVTITNTGNVPTGDLTLTLTGTGASAFTLNPAPTAISIFLGDPKSTLASIEAGATRSFTVTPKTRLAPGTHTATVTVYGGNGILPSSFGVSFRVAEPAYDPRYAISLSNNGTVVTLPDLVDNTYHSSQAQITVYNTGSLPTGPLTVTISGANPEVFRHYLNDDPIPSIMAGGYNDQVKIYSKSYLSAGTYNATVTIGNANVTTKSYNVRLTVTP